MKNGKRLVPLFFLLALSFVYCSCRNVSDEAGKKETPAIGQPASRPSPGNLSPSEEKQVLAFVGPESITQTALQLEAADRKYQSFRERPAKEVYRAALENLMGMRLLYLGALEDNTFRGSALEREIEVTRRIWLAGIYINEKMPGEIRPSKEDLGDAIPAHWIAADVSMIVLGSEKDAEALRAKIATGEQTFESAASLSIFPTREPGGRIGEILETTSYFPDKGHRRRIFDLPEGGMSQPFRGPLGWTLVRCNGKRALSRQEIDLIMENARSKYIAEKVEERKAEILKRRPVKRFPDRLGTENRKAVIAILGSETYTYQDFLTFAKIHLGESSSPQHQGKEGVLRSFGDHLAWGEEAGERGIDEDPLVMERMKLFTVERVSDEVRNRLAKDVSVSEKEAKAYFQKHPERYQGEDQAWIKTIFAEDAAVAEEVRRRANQGEDFDSLWKVFSTDEKKGGKEGEVLGPIRPNMMPGEFGAEVFSLREGDISRVLRAGDRFVVVKMMKYERGRKVPFSEARKRVISDLNAERTSPVVYEKLDQLKKRFPLFVHEEAFSEFVERNTKHLGGK